MPYFPPVLLASGARAGATEGAQTFEDGIVTGTVRPLTDSTAGLRAQNADGSKPNIFVVNTVSGYFGVGGVPTRTLTIYAPTSSLCSFNTDAGEVAYFGTGNNTVAGGDANELGFAADEVAICALNGTRRLSVRINGVGFGVTDPTALLHLAAGTTARAQMRFADGVAPTTPNDGDVARVSNATTFYTVDSNTNTVASQIVANRQSSGTPAAGFGVAFAAQLESSTTPDMNAGRLIWSWNDATHASRSAKGRLTANYAIVERECIAWAGGSSAAQVGFLGATPVGRTSAYSPTNVTTDRSYDADATTLDELADVVGTLIADLKLFGLLG